MSQSPQRRVAVIAAVRTPVGRYGGVLSSLRPDDLAALVVRAVVDRSGIDAALIDDIYLGAANQAGEDNRNVARMAALLAGLPVSVPGCTVNRLCASGLEAINVAARMIEAGHGDIMIAGGCESMSRAPFVMPKAAQAWSRSTEIHDTTIGWRFTNPALSRLHHPYSMGETAENVAERYGISREDQDAFAVWSQQKWALAQSMGLFDEEILPVEIPGRRGEAATVIHTDEHPRPETTIESLARLKPIFREGGSVTAGNSSGVNDGAAALLLADESRARALGLEPLAFIGASCAAGVDPAIMGMGPVPATLGAIRRAGLSIDEIGIIELNEAFAAQALACVRELGIDPQRVNPRGGAIAIGHPLGCTGARMVTSLIMQMRQTETKRGVATACIGVGQGLATVIELD